MERKEEDPEVLRLLAIFLRKLTRMNQAQLSTAAGVSQSLLSRIELGTETPSDDVLRRLAAATDVSWPLVTHLRGFFAAFLRARSRKVRLAETHALWPGAEDSLAVLTYLLADQVRDVPEAVHEAEAQRFWQSATGMPRQLRRKGIEISPRASRNPALARLLRQESEKAAASDPAEAKELAELAAWIEERTKRG
jgi:transcriptional regulator with XRE-family HTH domain